MKTNIIVKLGISMLVMLMTVGTVSASSYSNAENIDVPYGSFWIWDGETASDDWYQFYANNSEDIYIDVQLTFAEDGGEMKLHDREDDQASRGNNIQIRGRGDGSAKGIPETDRK